MTLKHWGSILLSFMLILSKTGWTQDTLKTAIIIDTLGNEIYLLNNSKNEPIEYFSPIFTPVCLDGTCYPIKINLFWDLAGQYKKYSLNKGEILTKIEHLPFSDFDYGLLHRVINNPNSALANFTIHELTDTNTPKVDGITGATRPELQGSFVPDALYTSHALWHLARKSTPKMINYTKKELIEKGLSSYLLYFEQGGCQQLVLKHIHQESNSENVIDTFQPIIDSTDNQLTALCISLIPNSELEMSKTRTLFCSTYASSENQKVKEEILRRWENDLKPSESEMVTIANSMGKSFASFESELKLLEREKNWPESVYYILLNKMENSSNMMRKEKFKKLLYSRSEYFPKKFKRELKKRGYS